MAGIVHVSEAATLGLHALAYLALARQRLVPAAEMAASLKLSAAHLAKVMQKLERVGLVKGRRGPAGGFQLKLSPRNISLRQIYESLEGSLQPKVCLLGKPLCNNQCPLGALLKNIENKISQQLGRMRLNQFAQACGVKYAKPQDHKVNGATGLTYLFAKSNS